MSTLQAQSTDWRSYTNADLGLRPDGSSIQAPANTTVTTPQATTSAMPTAPVNSPQQQALQKYPALTSQQQQQFSNLMLAQIQNAEAQVQKATATATDNTRMPMSFDKVVMENAIINLEVKKTLYQKFVNSPSIRSPKVQNLLIQILSKDSIQPGDLAQLQSVVDAERPYTYP
jgi:hypothetical protein